MQHPIVTTYIQHSRAIFVGTDKGAVALEQIVGGWCPCVPDVRVDDVPLDALALAERFGCRIACGINPFLCFISTNVVKPVLAFWGALVCACRVLLQPKLLVGTEPTLVRCPAERHAALKCRASPFVTPTQYIAGADGSGIEEISCGFSIPGRVRVGRAVFSDFICRDIPPPELVGFVGGRVFAHFTAGNVGATGGAGAQVGVGGGVDLCKDVAESLFQILTLRHGVKPPASIDRAVP